MMDENEEKFEEALAEFHMKMMLILGNIELFKSRTVEIVRSVETQARRPIDMEAAYMSFDAIRRTSNEFIDGLFENDEEDTNTEE